MGGASISSVSNAAIDAINNSQKLSFTVKSDMLTALTLATMAESVNGGLLSDLVTKLTGVGGLFNGATSPVMFNATFVNNFSTANNSAITGTPIASTGQENAIAITAIDAALSELNMANAMHGA